MTTTPTDRPPLATGWAVIGRDGLIGRLALWSTAVEGSGWWQAGFHTPEEIAEAKALGARAVRVEIREIEG